MTFKLWWTSKGRDIIIGISTFFLVPKKWKGAIKIVINIIDQWLALENDEGVSTFAANRGTTTLSSLKVPENIA